MSHLTSEIDTGERLCIRCRRLFISPLSTILKDQFDTSATSHSLSLAEFKTAALEDRCFLCLRAWLNIEPEISAAKLGDKQEIWVKYDLTKLVEDFDDEELFLWINWDISPALNIAQSYHGQLPELLVDYQIDHSVSTTPEWKNLDDSTGSRQTLERIKNWIEECASTHKGCGKGCSTSNYMPTRVIHIGTTGDVWRLQINEPSNKSQDTRYIALSYRWGQHQQLTLQTSNLKHFKDGLPISGLPKTFRDLVQVARMLGINYLWIDALCIIQNSDEDWKEESVRMRDIYANSYCTIAAAWAPDPTGGLFHARSPEEIRCGIINTTWALGAPSNLGTIRIFEQSAWNNQIMRSPLHRRGWALQERLLPPRLLYFTQHQILWECDTTRKCEAFVNQSPKEYSEPHEREERIYTWFESLGPSERGQLPLKLFRAWIQVVKTYSRCLLTMPGDKLVAIHGIASLFQDLSDDSYLLGIWVSRFFDCLIWRVQRGEGIISRPNEYRAPSWSWASIEGAIEMYHQTDFLGGETKAVFPFQSMGYYNTISEFGKPSQAFIRLRGYAPVYHPTEDQIFKKYTDDVLRVSVIFDSSFGFNPPDEERPVYFLLLKFTQRSSIVMQYPYYYKSGEGIMLQEAPILQWQADAMESRERKNRRSSPRRVIEGFKSMKQSTAPREKEYARVGYFSTQSWAEKHLRNFGLCEDEDGNIVPRPDIEQQTFKII